MSSSRRTSGEIHILAMLDGKTTGPLSTRFLALPASFWYGVAGIGVCVLLAALAWLAHTPAPAPDRGIEAASAAIGAAPTGPAHEVVPAPPADDNALLAVTALPPGHAPAPLAAGGATIVDVPTPAASPSSSPSSSPSTSPAASPLQPPAAPLAVADVPAPMPAPGPRSAPHSPPPPPHLPAVRAASTARIAARAVPAHGGARPDARPQPLAAAHGTAHAALAGTAAGNAAGASLSASIGASARTTIARPPTQHRSAAMPAPSLARSNPALHARRQPGAPKAVQPVAVDTDVALISAIIQHTGPQADAPAPAALPCAERPCGPRMPNRQ